MPSELHCWGITKCEDG